ncbi:MAG: type II toxin-antitoxin system RelE/ParE family toxin, partial [Candidatus Binatia bacterium]
KDARARARVRVRLDRLEDGNFGDSKPVDKGVIELRIDYGPVYRVYLGREGEMAVLLLCGDDKSSQQADIRRAQGYWADYRTRMT